METSDMVKIGVSVVVLALIGWWTVGWLFGEDEAEAAAPAPTIEAAPTDHIIQINTLPPLATPQEPAAPAQLEPAQIAATATFQAAISRPARMNDPAAAPSFIGVITYEDGCMISNIGFTTSGYNGKPFYLYVDQPFEQNPLLQIVQISGVVQEFEDCLHPVIFVSELQFFNLEGTPAPLAIGGPDHAITGTTAITAAAAAWGIHTTPMPAVKPGESMPDLGGYKPTPTATITAAVTITAPTPYPTYTPYPTTPPYIPPQRVIPAPANDDDDDPDPTATPSPTPTMTPTPIQANIDGPVIAVAGCPATNLAIKGPDKQQTFLVFDGAALPDTGSPTDYRALVIGVLDKICNGQAIKARLVTWYKPATPSPTATTVPATATATATTPPSATPSPTATTVPATATASPTTPPSATPTATEEPTTEPTTD